MLLGVYCIREGRGKIHGYRTISGEELKIEQSMVQRSNKSNFERGRAPTAPPVYVPD